MILIWYRLNQCSYVLYSWTYLYNDISNIEISLKYIGGKVKDNEGPGLCWWISKPSKRDKGGSLLTIYIQSHYTNKKKKKRKEGREMKGRRKQWSSELGGERGDCREGVEMLIEREREREREIW